MSEGIVIALVSAASAVICAGITAFGGIVVAGVKNNKSLSGGMIGLLIFCGAGVGLVVGALFGAMLMRQPSQSSLPILQPTADASSPTQQPGQIPSRTTCIDSPYTSLGNSWVGRVEEQVARGAIRTYSHCPPSNAIRYVSISVDDELSKVELVCANSTTDVTIQFSLLDAPNELLPVYESQAINVPEGCIINFTVRDTRGVNIGLMFQAASP